MQANNHYDYIIIGSGAAGLSLLMHIVEVPSIANKKILVLDKSHKTDNDRTWCFWQQEQSRYENILYKKWNTLQVKTKNYNTEQPIAPYTYKMLRGIDFYNYCKQHLSKYNNIKFEIATVTDVNNHPNNVEVKTTEATYAAQYVFSSVLLQQPTLLPKQDYLLQHFKGWIIETDKAVFNDQVATYMDFDINQQYGTSFVYVLPFSPTKALVEYTLFTAQELTAAQYDAGLKNYVEEKLQIENYTIKEVEQGIIPMTDYKFPSHEGNIIYIGTAGGCTRPSTGYTFTYVQRQANAIATALSAGVHPRSAAKPISKKSRIYDAIFLGVLSKDNMQFADYFTMLFAKTKIIHVLRFLDDKSSFWNDLKIILAMPKWPFIKSLWRKGLW